MLPISDRDLRESDLEYIHVTPLRMGRDTPWKWQGFVLRDDVPLFTGKFHDSGEDAYAEANDAYLDILIDRAEARDAQERADELADERSLPEIENAAPRRI